MNPEFERNLWLEAGPRRLAGAAVAIGLILVAAAVLGKADAKTLVGAFATTGLVLFGLCGVLWGSRAAGGAVLTEINGRTWDFQRLSAIAPWDMTWGKMLGSAALAWICALAGLAVFVVARSLQTSMAIVIAEATSLLAGAILLQAGAMAAALAGVRKARAEGRMAASGDILIGLVAGYFLLTSLIGVMGQGRTGGLPANQGGLQSLLFGGGIQIWWGVASDAATFAALSLCAFAAWAMVGAWRLMRLELQMRNSLVYWIGFVLFLPLWIAGLVAQDSHGGLMGTASVCVTAGVLAYAAAFVEPADRVRMGQFARAVRGRDLRQSLALMPAALVPLGLMAVTAVILCVFPAPDILATQDPGFGGKTGFAVGLATLAFVVRDLGVIAYFRFGSKPQRGDIGAVVCLFLLYGVGTLLASAVLDGVGQKLMLPVDPVISLISGGAQAALVWVLASRRIGGPASAAS
jgi:hypothetical protein